MVYPFAYGVVRRMVDSMEIAWEEVEDEERLADILDLVVEPAEIYGLDDDRLTLRAWFRRCCAKDELRYLVDRLERLPLPLAVKAQLYDSCELPVAYTPDRAPELPGGRIHYGVEDPGRFPLEPIIRTPVRGVGRGGRRELRVALETLCGRGLEIHPLTWGDARDVRRVRVGRGLEVVLIGMMPEFRSPLESLQFFMVVKNGVPVAYGPAAALLGCCEMGINLFPEFRGGEIRYIYAQVMRVLRHVLGVEYFFLVRYGMGVDNEEAIQAGAFWFYRKLGFRATNPKVEALARREEAKMRARPGHRSSVSMLRRLSHTEAHFDLSGGRCKPIDVAKIGLRVSRSRGTRKPGISMKGGAFEAVAPILRLIPGLSRWSRAEKESLGAAIRRKGGRSDARAFVRHERFEAALRRLAT